MPTSHLSPSWHLPHGGLALDSLADHILQPGVKGLPLQAPLRQGAIGVQGWNILAGDTSYPVAVLKAQALRHNLDWMRAFCQRYQVLLAPHGKTTMSPQLFGAQLANGAWGMTLASVGQLHIAHRFGVRRVLIANQVVAPADLASLVALLRGDPDFEAIVLADSPAGVERLAQAAATLARPLPVLVELGMAGKRAGCRGADQALALARTVATSPGLALAGFEGYEGLISSSDAQADAAAVSDFVGQLAALVRAADNEGLFGGPAIVLTAGGSAYFDLVARGFGHMPALSRPLQAILRSGCYLTSDHGSYQRLIAQADAREHTSTTTGLQPALEVWSVVLSRPEPGLAILSMGKRDASYDMDLPIPLASHRPGPGTPVPLPDGSSIFKMNDQHAYLRVPADCTLAVGDLVCCGISHPCTTFDKWPVLLLVDDDYQVLSAINTFF